MIFFWKIWVYLGLIEFLGVVYKWRPSEPIFWDHTLTPKYGISLRIVAD